MKESPTLSKTQQHPPQKKHRWLMIMIPLFFPKTQKMTMEECLAPVIEEAVGVGVSQLTRRIWTTRNDFLPKKNPKR